MLRRSCNSIWMPGDARGGHHILPRVRMRWRLMLTGNDSLLGFRDLTTAIGPSISWKKSLFHDIQTTCSRLHENLHFIDYSLQQAISNCIKSI